MICCLIFKTHPILLLLTPGFSPVSSDHGTLKPFQRFCHTLETVETVWNFTALPTGLKPGGNERALSVA